MSVDDASAQADDWCTSEMYFRDTLRTLSLGADAQIAAVGGPHVAWELRQDAIDFGSAVVQSSNGRLSEEIVRGIQVLMDALHRLPEDSYQGEAREALRHPQWREVRELAEALGGAFEA